MFIKFPGFRKITNFGTRMLEVIIVYRVCPLYYGVIPIPDYTGASECIRYTEKHKDKTDLY